MLAARMTLSAAVGLTLGLCLTATPVLAAQAYTGDAAASETTATAYGYVNPQGENTLWVFAYGPTAKLGGRSKIGSIPAGDADVLVAAPLRGLRAGRTYHFRLLALPYDSANNPDWAHASWGQDETFTTTRGNLRLLSSKLTVRRGAVSLPLECASTLTCAGRFSLSVHTRVGRAVKSIRCASERFRLGRGAKATLSPKLSSDCLALVRSARGRRLTATATARMSTGQTAPDQTVTLSG